MNAKTNQHPTPPGRAEQLIRLRIICLRPPTPEQYGAEFGLQDNSTTTDIHFECECRVRPQKTTDAPNFLGSFVQGSPAARFLYLSWRPRAWRPGQPEPACAKWVRRMKVHLRSISWEQIDEVTKANGVLEAVIPGTGRDGSPSCGSVPLVGGTWVVRNK
jgi:hypothetical protein